MNAGPFHSPDCEDKDTVMLGGHHVCQPSPMNVMPKVHLTGCVDWNSVTKDGMHVCIVTPCPRSLEQRVQELERQVAFLTAHYCCFKCNDPQKTLVAWTNDGYPVCSDCVRAPFPSSCSKCQKKDHGLVLIKTQEGEWVCSECIKK